MPTLSPQWRVAAALGTLYLVWGATYLAIRVAVTSLPTCWLCAVRYTLASVVLIALAAATRQVRPTKQQVGWASVIGLMSILGMNGLVVYAERTISSGLAAVLVASLPLWLVGLDWLGGKGPTALRLLGCAIGFTGVALLCGRDLTGGTAGSLPAIACVLGGTLLNGVSILLARRVRMPASGLYQSACAQGASALGFIVLSTVFKEQVAVAAVPLEAWLALAFLVVFGSVIGYSAYFWLIQNAKPEVLSTYAFVNPVVAVVLGAVLLAEPLDGWMLMGGGAIVAAVALLSLPELWKKAREARPALASSR